MIDRAHYLKRVELSARRALRGQTPSDLVAYSFDVDTDKGIILLPAHFDHEPTEADLEDISVAQTEIEADFLDDLTAQTDVEVVRPGRASTLLGGGTTYRRE